MRETDGSRHGYDGTDTTGFQSPAQDHAELVIDLAQVLDLSKPGVYPVRVTGHALRSRGIFDGDILIANTAADPAPGRVAVAFVQGAVLLAVLARRPDGWWLLPRGRDENPIPVSEDAEVWAIVSGLVRTQV